jgi:hypothetical protein
MEVQNVNVLLELKKLSEREELKKKYHVNEHIAASDL